MIKQTLPARVTAGTVSADFGEALVDPLDRALRRSRSKIGAEQCLLEPAVCEAPGLPLRKARPHSYEAWQSSETGNVQDWQIGSGFQSARVTEKFAESYGVRKFRPSRRGVFERTDVKHQHTRSLAR